MKVTTATINAALKKAGHKERIINGDGYFYWVNGYADDIDWWESVYVQSANQLSLHRWMEIHKENLSRSIGE